MEFAKNFAASKAHHKEHFWTVCLEPFTPEFLPKLTTTSPAFGLYGWSLSPRNSPKSSPRGTLLDCMFRAFHSGTPPKAHHKEHFWTVCLEPFSPEFLPKTHHDEPHFWTVCLERFTPELPQKLTARNTFGLCVSSLSLRNSSKRSPQGTLLDCMFRAFHSRTPTKAHHKEHCWTVCFDPFTPEFPQKLTTRNTFGLYVSSLSLRNS